MLGTACGSRLIIHNVSLIAIMSDITASKSSANKPLLTVDQANTLLSQITEVEVASIDRIVNKNDVFKILLTDQSKYFVKFHTADWYSEVEDTRDVAGRECLCVELLKHKGVELKYHVWKDCS